LHTIPRQALSRAIATRAGVAFGNAQAAEMSHHWKSDYRNCCSEHSVHDCPRCEFRDPVPIEEYVPALKGKGCLTQLAVAPFVILAPPVRVILLILIDLCIWGAIRSFFPDFYDFVTRDGEFGTLAYLAITILLTMLACAAVRKALVFLSDDLTVIKTVIAEFVVLILLFVPLRLFYRDQIVKSATQWVQKTKISNPEDVKKLRRPRPAPPRNQK
jgi:hypothetical protein